MATPTPKTVRAHYKSATDEREFVLPISTPFSEHSSVEEKSAYLGDLRANTKTLQADINAFLTEKMAEDKAREGADVKTNSTHKGQRAQEELDEDNYGEEEQEG